MSNNLGDMLIELADPSTSETRKLEIGRLFNEFSAREDIYKSWLSPSGKDPSFNVVNAVRGNFLYPPSGLSVRVYATSQNIANATDTDITFSATYYDDAFFFNASTPTAILIPVTGKYLVSGRCMFAGNTTGYRSLWCIADGAGSSVRDNRGVTAASVTLSLYDEINFTAGDLVRMKCHQTSGGALSLSWAIWTVRLLKIKDAET